MLDGLKVVRSALDDFRPALFGFCAPAQSKERGGEVGSRFEMVRIEFEHALIELECILVSAQPIGQTATQIVAVDPLPAGMIAQCEHAGQGRPCPRDGCGLRRCGDLRI